MSGFYESPELLRLFKVYSDTKAPGRNSIGDHLSVLSMQEHSGDTLIVATATHLAVYPGDGRPPQVQGFRTNIPAFTELTAVSHFGPAIGSIVAIKNRGHEIWRADAEALLRESRLVRAANDEALWAERIGLDVFRGREAAMADLTDYACLIAERYLERSLADPDYLSGASLRDDYLDGSPRPDLPVSGNRIMIATFGLVALEMINRLILWFDELGVDWSRTLFAVAGRQGRPTGGITKSTTNLARIMHIIAQGRLDERRVFLAPHLPVFPPPAAGDLAGVAALEEELRWQLARVMSSAELAPLMFEGYPEFVQPPLYGPPLEPDSRFLSESPRIRAVDDWQTMFARLRLSLEDPRQLLAAGVTDYIAEQLVAHGNDPSAVFVPGFDGEPYPIRSGRSG